MQGKDKGLDRRGLKRKGPSPSGASECLVSPAGISHPPREGRRLLKHRPRSLTKGKKPLKRSPRECDGQGVFFWIDLITIKLEQLELGSSKSSSKSDDP